MTDNMNNVIRHEIEIFLKKLDLVKEKTLEDYINELHTRITGQMYNPYQSPTMIVSPNTWKGLNDLLNK